MVLSAQRYNPPDSFITGISIPTVSATSKVIASLQCVRDASYKELTHGNTYQTEDDMRAGQAAVSKESK